VLIDVAMIVFISLWTLLAIRNASMFDMNAHRLLAMFANQRNVGHYSLNSLRSHCYHTDGYSNIRLNGCIF
jgi:hypothetical protein